MRMLWLAVVLTVVFPNFLFAQNDIRVLSTNKTSTLEKEMNQAADVQVGSRATMRLLKTERAINYKLAATWLTPEVIFASARALQLRGRLNDEQTLALVDEAQGADGDTVVMVDIDPNEGSGVVPLDWEVFLQPKGRADRAVAGVKTSKLREVRALQGVMRRNYDYDRFWVAFPLRGTEGQPLFRETDREAELIVRVYDREGRVTWPVPASIRERQSTRGR
jgi:hypothetical protein